MKTSKELILAELRNSHPLEWRPGMQIPVGANHYQLWNTPASGAAGNVDSSAAGYQYAIQTTTLIRAKTVDQKFYTIPFAEYIPVIPGEAAWLEDIRTNEVYSIGGSFEEGLVNQANQKSALSRVTTAITPVTQKIALWAKKFDYSIFEINKALAADNWNPIEGKTKSLKQNWDLGLQVVAFLGLLSDQTNFPGLLSNPNINVNTAVITKNLSSFAYADFQTFVSTVMSAYVSNSNNTEMPDHFGIPLADWLGLAAYVNPQYPLPGTMLVDALQNAFAKITGNASFKIFPILYGNMAVNAGYWTVNGTYR